MILKELILKLESSEHPLAKAIHKGENFKVLAIAFKKGMVLKEHKTSFTAKLTVLQGKVIYKVGTITKELNQYDDTDIPVGIIHSVEASSDALCLLTQG
jgi:quercetin dioxygenase-like cupin family protein